MTSTLARGLTPVRIQLANGAVVIHQETPVTPAVTIRAAFRAGSLFDPPGLEGLASMTGRVLDRGTVRRDAGRIADELDSRGVSVKVSVSRHTLTLSCTCLTEDFDDILNLVCEVLRWPTFPADEVAKRRGEAVTALRQREDNPASRAGDGALELLYGAAHPYGRCTKGSLAGVERLSREDLAAFQAAHLAPNALSLAIVGDIPAPYAVERAALELEEWPARVVDPGQVPPSPAPQGRRQRVIPMPGKSQTDVVYGFVGVRRADPRYYACWMMNNILGQFGLGGRLAENIRERQGMAYYAFSTLDVAAGEAPLLIKAGVDPRHVERALAAVDHEVAAFAAEGPTPREVEETRASLIGGIPRMLETNQGIAAFLQTCEEFGLGLDFDQRLPARLRAVTLDDVRAAAAAILVPDRAAVAIAGPPIGG